MWRNNTKKPTNSFLCERKSLKKYYYCVSVDSPKHITRLTSSLLLRFNKVFLLSSKRIMKKPVNMTANYIVFLWGASNTDWSLISNFTDQFFSNTHITASRWIKLSKWWILASKGVPNGAIFFLSKIFGKNLYNFLFMLKVFKLFNFKTFNAWFFSLKLWSPFAFLRKIACICICARTFVLLSSFNKFCQKQIDEMISS